MKFLTLSHYCIWVLLFNGLGVWEWKLGKMKLVDSVVQSRKLSACSLLLRSEQRWLGSPVSVACADDWDQSGLQQGHWVSVQGHGLLWVICLHESGVSSGYVIWKSCIEPASRALGAVALAQILGRVKHTNMALRGQNLLKSSLVRWLILALLHWPNHDASSVCLLASKIGIITQLSVTVH